MSVERLALSAPDMPAQTVVHTDEIHVLAVHMSKPNHRKQRGAPVPNQRSWTRDQHRTYRRIYPVEAPTNTVTKILWEGLSHLVTLRRKLQSHARLRILRVNCVTLKACRSLLLHDSHEKNLQCQNYTMRDSLSRHGCNISGRTLPVCLS